MPENEEISTEVENIQVNDLGEGVASDEETEEIPEQLTESSSRDNPETPSSSTLSFPDKLSKLQEFGYKAAKIPVFPPAPTLSSPIQSTSNNSQVQDNYPQQSEILQPSEELASNEKISTEAENIQVNDLGEGVTSDEETEEILEQLTESSSRDNPETPSSSTLSLPDKLSKLPEFGYNGAKIPVFPPAPTLSSPIQSTSNNSQVQDNSQQQPEILQPSEELTENEEISTETENIQRDDLGEVISDEEEKESDSEQLTEAELRDNPETQSQEKLDFQAKFSKLAQFGYNAAKIPVFAPAPTPQIAIGPKSGISQVENNYQEKPQELQSDEVEKDNEEISTEGEKNQFGVGVSGDEDNKLIQAQLVAGESLAEAQDEQWQKKIDIPGAIAYNKKRYSQETTLVIQDTLILQRFLQINTENYLGEFNEETIIAIAKWQEAKALPEIDGKIGYATRQSLGITQRLFDDEKGYGFNYFPGQPFVRGAEDPDEIATNDVAQGNLGNCYFAAGMMAVALANPSLIRELIKDNGDGSYNVTLYPEEGKKVEIKVTPYFPTVAPGIPAYAQGGDKQELWPMLLEKAYAQYQEGYGETGKGEGGYDLIGSGGTPGDAVKVLTGPLTQEYTEKYDYKMPDVHFVKDWEWQGLVRGIKWGLSEHWAVTAATIEPPDGEEKSTKKSQKKVGENGIYFNHAYVIESLKEPEGEATPDNTLLNLLNPWGEEHISGLSMRLFKEYFGTLYINPVSQKYVPQKTPVTQSELASPSKSKPVTEMSAEEKIAAAISVAIAKLPGELGEKLKELLNPASLALMAGILIAWGISHGTGAGQVLDVILIGVGVVTLGQDVISVIEDLIGFAGVLNAQTWSDIDSSGEHLAEAIVTVGLELIIQFLTHRLAGSKAKKPELDEAGVPRRGRVSVQEELTHFSTREGHELIVTKAGQIFRCSSCEELGVQFAKLLEENPEFAGRLGELEGKYQRIAQMRESTERKALLEEADGELTQLERKIQELNIKRANRLLDPALDKFQPDEEITREVVAQLLKKILKSGSTEEQVALSKLVDELLGGGDAAAISNFLHRVTRIQEVDGVVNGKFDQLYEAFHRGDAILAHGPLQPAIFPSKAHRLHDGQYSIEGSIDGKPSQQIMNSLEGVVDFVIVYDGGNMRLILGRNHSGLSGGRASVYGAGELLIEKSGKVIEINNRSGHYLPTPENGQRSFSLLVQKRFVKADTLLRIFDF